MQRTYSPEALARREARKAETKARNEAKKQALLAARQAEIEAARQAYLDVQQKRRDDFKASLSEADWADLQIALSEKSSETDATGFTRVTNDWLHSVQQQFTSRGWLSPKQLEPLLRSVRRKREQAEKAEAWPTINVGDKVKVFGKVLAATEGRGDFGLFYKMTLLTHYGRRVNIKTGRREWYEYALKAKENDKRVFIHAKVKWIAPEAGGVFVLTSRGAKFGDLL
jgi:hypothetical protein